MLSRGKEFAIVCGKGSLTIGLGTGAAFHVGALEELDQVPLNYRCNTVFSLSDGVAIFIVDCHTKQNQVTFAWREGESPFDSTRGPHLLHGGLLEYISSCLKENKNEKYFRVSNT